jgi:tRNA dimethylallyltransferase
MKCERFTLYVSRAMIEKRPLVVLLGPTAVGKSMIAVQLAKVLDTEVLTADSRQVYRGMDIGTDKPSVAERHGVPHRLIDLANPDERFNVGLFRRAAVAEIERLYRGGRLPLVVGGTGLWVRALVRGLWDGPTADWHYREQLERDVREHGSAALHERLAAVDPESAARLHPNDMVKIIRALEVYHLRGRPLSDGHRRHGFSERPFAALLIGLMRERQALYRRIEERVEVELAKGLVDETRRLLAHGYGRDLGSMKGLGYRQMAGYLGGESSYADAVEVLKRDTRRFAKRQLTWFRKEPGITWLHLDEDETVERTVSRIMDCIERFLVHLAGQEEPIADGR